MLTRSFRQLRSPVTSSVGDSGAASFDMVQSPHACCRQSEFGIALTRDEWFDTFV